MAPFHDHAGMRQKMKWIRYDIHTTTQDAEIIGEVLLACGINGYEITDHVPLSAEEEREMFTDIPADLGEDDGTSVLTFYTEAPENEERVFFSTGSSLRDDTREESAPVLEPEEWIRKFMKALEEKQRFFPLEIPVVEYTVQDDALWKDKWKENFGAFRVADDIIIKPSWEAVPKDAKKDDKIIEIDPGSAFGSGTHETTKLCLLSLRKYITPETEIMDAGCGSGILAIASVLCGAKSVFCLDIDALAVAAAIENAGKNHIPDEKLQAVHANILEDAEEIKKKHPGKFHIIAANILADVIIPLSSVVRSFLAEGGIFLSSGILTERADEVERALQKNGFEIVEKNVMGEWCAFVAK